MSRAPFTIDAAALHAYADGQLSAAEREAVELHLAAHPEASTELAAWERQNEALRALFPAANGEAIPPRLSPHRIAHVQHTARFERLRNIAAALALVVLGSGIGWFGRDYLTPTEAASDHLIEAALTAHTLYVREKSRAVEVAAEAPNLMTWLSDRTMTSIDAPDLTAEGYVFLGGRLLPSAPGYGVPGPAAQLMYENASAERLTLYITAPLADKREAWQLVSQGTIEAYYWANDAVTCTIVAALPETEIRQLGRKVFEQLTRRPENALSQW